MAIVAALPAQVFPYGLPNEANAYYSRTQQALVFGNFLPQGGGSSSRGAGQGSKGGTQGGQGGRVYTCRSLDIVAHETGHAILDGLKPAWMSSTRSPQTGALHEAFGDLTAIFLSLSQVWRCFFLFF